MGLKETLEILAAVATIIATAVGVGGIIIAWQKRFFHNLHDAIKHHIKKIKEEENKDKQL